MPILSTTQHSGKILTSSLFFRYAPACVSILCDCNYYDFMFSHSSSRCFTSELTYCRCIETTRQRRTLNT